MESVVPPQITAELTQILSNLVLGDNDIRAKYVVLSTCFMLNNRCVFSAEKAVNERLTHTPELYLLALAQFAITADTEVVNKSFVYCGVLLMALVDAILLACSPSTSAF